MADSATELTPRRSKIDPHAARSRLLFDEIAQKSEDEFNLSESKDDVEMDNLLSTEVLEATDNDNDDDDNYNTDEETEAWISCNRSESEEPKLVVNDVASSSSSWNEDVFDKPSMVV